MSVSLLAERYAAALARAAASAGALEAVGRDMEFLGRAVAESAELAQALDRPRLPAAAKAAILRALFREPPHELSEAFIRLVTDRGRASHLGDIAAASVEAIEEQAGLGVAEIRTATALTPEQQEALRERLSSYAGRQVKLKVQLEPALKGGLMVRLADTVFDGTVGAYLEDVHRRLSGASTPFGSVHLR